ncbi:FkbM family methyltransferase [Quatrionicoccus australiensis]|uniref:FkbM family methyltransferase n=1 Tax=Quatrionicoccus australiensis TaxID=138118 RepID=UPI00384C39BB
MKIDIEGMEEMALAGAVETIERNRPLVLIEWLKSDKQKLAAFFEQRQYEVFVMGGNFLCLPQGSSIKISHQLPRWGAE